MPSARASFSPEDERWALLHRVVTSQPFQKSNRLRELLLFVGERSLLAPDAAIHEQEIGVELFGRPVEYDTNQDTLVRVLASQLRKKLQQYFAEDGKAEPMVIDLPKGSYVPVFRVRNDIQSTAAVRSGTAWLLWVSSGALALLCGILLVQNASLRRRADLGMGPAPHLTRLWRQMFGNGANTYLVLSDANLVVFEDAIRRHLSIQEYQNKLFAPLANELIQDGENRTLMLNLVGRVYTGFSDAIAARRIGVVCAANELPLEVVIARDTTAAQVTAHNTILLGSRRANPWVNLFEDKLNFRTGFEETPRVAYFTNQSPKHGEESEYRGRFGSLGYCRVATLPNPKGGNVLLITGTDVGSTDAGGDFVTSEKWIRALRERLGLRDSDAFPHFEALLRGQVVNNSVPQFQLVAVRRH